LVKNILSEGYYSDANTTGIWRHKKRRTCFALCVDDFGVKYYNRADAEHLIESLKKYYEVCIDWSGENYCGARLKWNYEQGYVDMSMSGYINSALKKYNHKPSSRLQYAPFKTAPI